MASSFASVHFIGVDEDCDKYIELIKPNIKSGVFIGFDSLHDIELLTVKTNYGLALYCEEFGIESIDQTVRKSYINEKYLTVLTAGILDGDIISVSIIQSGEIVSNITIRSDDCPKDIYEDIVERWYNCKLFEDLFGVSQEMLMQRLEEDVHDTLLNWSELLQMHFAQPYYTIDQETNNCVKRKFHIKRDQLIKKAKTVDIEDFAKKFMKYLNF